MIDGNNRRVRVIDSHTGGEPPRGKVYPSIKGAAFVNADAELLLDPQDPFCMGIRV
jgi:proline racemase